VKIIQAANELRASTRKVCVTIGFFDGVHLGHQEIIRQTIAHAQRHDGMALITTFDQHPNAVVAPQRCPPLLYSLPQKLRTIATLGPDALLLIHFDHAFSQQTGEQFVRSLARDVGQLQCVCVGAGFTFGHKRSGNIALLEKLGAELGFPVLAVPAVSQNGNVISSTRVREAVQAGEFQLASQMLGRPYALAGIVERGDQVGHKLGFPTANLNVAGLVLPPKGVYTADTVAQGRTFRSVLNIGTRPTLQSSDPSLHVEVHLLDFNGDLYGQELEVIFRKKVRDEQKFASVGELKAQITRDIESSRSANP
jgi:riboflavin kinase/FMN adenylyltransferase